MPFNSYYYIIFFLLTVGVYFILSKSSYASAGKTLLVLASLYFYGFMNFSFVPLILFSHLPKNEHPIRCEPSMTFQLYCWILLGVNLDIQTLIINFERWKLIVDNLQYAKKSADPNVEF